MSKKTDSGLLEGHFWDYHESRSLKAILFSKKMNNKDATFLYKYFPLRKDNKDDLSHVKSVLEENALYFSRLKDFNDPFDCLPIYCAPSEDFQCWFEQLSKSGKYKRADLEIANSNWKKGEATSSQLVETMRSKMQMAISEELGICCFSGKQDNLLMWAHYASFHTGICFEFRRTPNEPFFGKALPIYYKPERPKINIFRRNQGVANDVFLTKSSDWEYESEYRIIGPDHKPGLAHKFSKECLIGIIFGARIERESEVILKESIKNSHSISIKKAKLDNSLYKINIENYS